MKWDFQSIKKDLNTRENFFNFAKVSYIFITKQKLDFLYNV